MSHTRITFSFILAIACMLAHAQVPPCTHYQGDLTVGSLGIDQARDGITTSDGSIVVIGNLANEIGGNIISSRYGSIDGMMMKVSSTGDLLWSKVYGGSGSDILLWVVELPDHGFLVAGSTESIDGLIPGPRFSTQDGWCMRLDLDGEVLWSKRYGGSDYTSLFVDGVLLDDGAILISNIGPGVRIDLEGNVLASSPNFSGDRIVKGADGSFLVTRSIPLQMAVAPFLAEGVGGDPIGDVGVMNMDQDGNLNWVNRIKSTGVEYSGPVVPLVDGYLLALNSREGTVAFERTSPPHGDGDIWLVRMDAGGSILWDRTIGSVQDDKARDVLPTSDGGFILYGRTNGAPSIDVTEPSRGDPDLWVVRTDGLGNIVWDKRWGGSGDDDPANILPTPFGYMLVANSTSAKSADHQSESINSGDIWLFRMEPGTPGHWYPDTDGDGFGENGSEQILDCDQPTGYVENDWDCNDAIANPPGRFLGAACNDGDWSTIADRVQPGCACAGTFVDVSAVSEHRFTLWPDAHPGEITWDLIEIRTHQLVLHGGPYPNGIPGMPISESVMVPFTENQRFQLYVYDSGGDGFPGGKFEFTIGGQPVIVGDGNFQYASTVSAQLQPLRSPLGNFGLEETSCDQVLGPNDVITATEDLEVTLRYPQRDKQTGYQFWIFDPNGAYSKRVYRNLLHPGHGGGQGADRPRNLQLSSVGQLPQDVLLNVRVRTKVDGRFGEFGPACSMKITSNGCATTQLNDQPNDLHFSCGRSFQLNSEQQVWAFPVQGVNRYEFRFTDEETGNATTYRNEEPFVPMYASANLQLQAWHIYSVHVRCSTDGGITWCPYGPVCKITTEEAAQAPPVPGDLRSIGAGAMHLYPNPVTNGLLHLVLPETNEMDGAIEVSVMDMTGRVVLRRTVDMETLDQGRLDVQVDLKPGAYGMLVSQGEVRFRQQFIVQ